MIILPNRVFLCWRPYQMGLHDRVQVKGFHTKHPAKASILHASLREGFRTGKSACACGGTHTPTPRRGFIYAGRDVPFINQNGGQMTWRGISRSAFIFPLSLWFYTVADRDKSD